MNSEFGHARPGLVCLILAGVTAIGLTACGGGSSSETASPIAPTSPVAAVREQINGIFVPPEPDPVANAATVAGVDVDGSGIRDDIDRRIAREFGNESVLYTKAVLFAKTEQAALLNPAPAVIEAHLAALGCIGDRAAVDRLSSMTKAVVNTPTRGRAYAKAFAGVTISERSCS